MGMMPCWLLLVGAQAQAYAVKQNEAGDPLRWIDGNLGYWVNPENAQGISASQFRFMTDAAAFSWSSVQGVSLNFEYLGETSASGADYTDGKNIVYFEDEWPEEWDPSFLALTFTWSIEGGEIIAFDLAINEDDFDYTATGRGETNDLMNMLTHEFGHVIGLSHSEVEGATMYHQARTGETDKRNLALDDEEGARYLYGDLLAARAGCATAAGPSGAPGWAGLAGGAFSLAAAIGLRSRRRQPEA